MSQSGSSRNQKDHWFKSHAKCLSVFEQDTELHIPFHSLPMEEQSLESAVPPTDCVHPVPLLCG